MKFTPRSDEEISAMGFMDAGMYRFTVLDATDQISKTGNHMIKLTLRVQDADGMMHTVYDYLLEKMEFKLKHFCKNTGLISKYDSGELTSADCIDKTGVVEIIVQKGCEKYDGSKYPDKNAVKDYIPGIASMRKDPVPEKSGHPAFDDADIPF